MSNKRKLKKKKKKVVENLIGQVTGGRPVLGDAHGSDRVHSISCSTNTKALKLVPCTVADTGCAKMTVTSSLLSDHYLQTNIVSVICTWIEFCYGFYGVKNGRNLNQGKAQGGLL
jgi:hypothetical protein